MDIFLQCIHEDDFIYYNIIYLIVILFRRRIIFIVMMSIVQIKNKIFLENYLQIFPNNFIILTSTYSY